MNLCARCVAGMLINRMLEPHVRWEYDDDRDAFQERFPGLTFGAPPPTRLPILAEILVFALERGREITVGSQYIEMTGLTWYGDPICTGHLIQAYERELSPATVRMAQWRA